MKSSGEESRDKKEHFDSAVHACLRRHRAQSNQTKTVIEVLAGAQTKNIPRPRQGKRLTDQVNLQSGDRCVFECFLTPLHCEGKLCFSLLFRGWLKHKCCENEEFGGLFWKNDNNTKRKKRKSKCATKDTWLQENKWLDFRTAGQLVSPCWCTGLGFLLFSSPHLFPHRHSNWFPRIGGGGHILQSGMGLNFTKESSNHRRCIWWHQWNIVA